MKFSSTLKLLGTSFLLVLLTIPVHSQIGYGSIKGKFTDQNNGEPIPFANVVAKQNNVVVLRAQTDFDGNYFIKPLQPGVYSIEATFTGYATKVISNITVNADEITFVNIQSTASANLATVVIEAVKEPLVRKDGGNQQVVTRSGIKNMPGRSGEPIAKTIGGVSTSGNRGGMVIRGARVDGFATNTTNESYGKFSENQFLKTSKNPLSTFSIDVDAASYSNVRRLFNAGQFPYPEAVRSEEMINYFNYNYPEPANSEAFSISTEVASCPWNQKARIVQIGIQGKRIGNEKLPKSNLVFLVDVSGSMDSPNKLPLAQQSLRMLVNTLREEDKVAIVVYAGNSGLALPSTSCKNKDAIYAAIDNMRAGGSTAGGAGILLAYDVAVDNFIKNGNNRVILMTDGDFNVGVSDNKGLEDLISEKRQTGVFLSVLGYGMGNIKDDKMEILADKGNGNYAYIDSYMEAQRVLVKEIGSTLFTIAKDVKIQVEFNPAVVKSYRLIGYENRLLADEDFNNDEKDAGEIGAGKSVTAIYEVLALESDVPGKSRIDELKYQTKEESKKGILLDEMLTVKVRYKDPKENNSKLLEKVVLNQSVNINSATKNIQFASAVAGFSFLLRNVKTTDSFDYEAVKKLAIQGRDNDSEGYRAELIRLIDLAVSLQKTASKE